MEYYHYTTFSALKGIIENKSIWLMSANNVNDPKEFKSGIDDIHNIIKKLAEESQVPSLKSTCSQLCLCFRTESELLEKTYFMSCFSKDPDSLVHWRAYADNTTGMAICFNLDLIKGILEDSGLSEQNQVVNIRDVLYADSDKEIALSDFIDKNSKSCRGFKLMNLIYESFIPRFKDSSFSSEKETRLFSVYDGVISSGMVESKDFKKSREMIAQLKKLCDEIGISHNDILFDHSTTIRPYHSISLNAIAKIGNVGLSEIITKIILGPNCPQNRKDLKLFLNYSSFSNTPVELSNIQIKF